MESITVRTTLDLADWNALLKACAGRARDKRNRNSAWAKLGPLIAWVVFAGVAFWFFSTERPIATPSAMFAVAVLFGATIYAYALFNRMGYEPDHDGSILDTTTFVFESGGFTTTKSNAHSRQSWTIVTDVSSNGTHVFLWIDSISAFVVPARDLPSPLTAGDFINRTKAFMEAARGIPADPAPLPPSVFAAAAASSAQTAPSAQSLPSVGQELLALARLQSLGSADPAHLHGRDLTIALLGGIGLGVWVLLSRLTYWGSNPQFFWYGLGGLAQLAAWPLLSAWLMSRASSPDIPVRRTLLLVLGAVPMATTLLAMADCLPQSIALVPVVVAIGFTVRYFLAGTKTMSGRTQGGAVAATTIASVAIVFLSSSYLIGPSLWFSPDADDDYAEEPVDHERIQFEQSSRIDSRLAAMPASVPGTNYFVGFAGFGDQRVFADEIAKASQVIGARYGTKEFSLSLVNDRRDLDKQPLASNSALRHALTQLGKRMDRDSDVLFLSLSSHGSEDATISVSNGMMYWNDLSAGSLREMLDQSGIRWRVIIVSACHAGSFIEPLKNDDTIILTAAAKERTSFGCSDDRDLTYFGEAFYRDALPGAASLRAAFDAARESIAKREKAEGITESDPQAWFGPAMEAKLAGLEPAS